MDTQKRPYAVEILARVIGALKHPSRPAHSEIAWAFGLRPSQVRRIATWDTVDPVTWRALRPHPITHRDREQARDRDDAIWLYWLRGEDPRVIADRMGLDRAVVRFAVRRKRWQIIQEFSVEHAGTDHDEVAAFIDRQRALARP